MCARGSVITGKQLIKLLQKDGWVRGRRTKHGVSMAKPFSDHTKVTIIPDTRASLDTGTLGAILGVKQTCLGKKGLFRLIEKHGI